MRGRPVLILLILVVGLVAFIELYEHDLPSSEERAALEKLVLDAEASEITVIDMVWGEEHVRLERELAEVDGQEKEADLTRFAWRLVEPLSAQADSDLVASLIESLTTLEKNRTLQGTAPEDVGLIPPRLVVTLTAGSREFEMRVGSDVPAGSSMIVTAGSDGEIVVVDNSFWVDMTRVPGGWRSREVLGFAPESIGRIALERAGQRLVLARQGPDFWLESPLVDLADAEKVRSLLAVLASMRVVSFADELPKSIIGPFLQSPVGLLEITGSEDAEVLRLEWGSEVEGPAPQHYARADDQVFSTDADLQQYFDTPIPEWRSLDLTSMESFQIDALRVVQPGQDTMRLGRDGANWTRDEDEISFTSVSDLLYAVTGARADAVLIEAKQDLLKGSRSELLLELTLQGGDREQSVSFHSLDEEGARAVVDNREVVLLLGKDEFTEILAKVDQIRAADSVKTATDEQLLSDGRDLNSDQQR